MVVAGPGRGGGGMKSFAVQILNGPWLMVFGSLLIMSAAGATYMFGLYSEEIKKSLGYDQTTVTLLSFFKDLGSNVGVLSGLIAEIPAELYNAFISAIDNGNIRTMPNRSMPAAPYPTLGALLLGDAFNMRHPLIGGGMTVALSHIVVLRDLLRPLHDLNNPSILCKYLESFYTLHKPTASTINTLAGALYKVFSGSSDLARRELRQACFDYLSLGGAFSNGPITLLSGMNPRPIYLVLHFIAVAIYGVGHLLLPFPSLKRLTLGIKLLTGALNIIFPILRAKGFRLVFFPLTNTGLL